MNLYNIESKAGDCYVAAKDFEEALSKYKSGIIRKTEQYGPAHVRWITKITLLGERMPEDTRIPRTWFIY